MNVEHVVVYLRLIHHAPVRDVGFAVLILLRLNHLLNLVVLFLRGVDFFGLFDLHVLNVYYWVFRLLTLIKVFVPVG